MVRLGWPSSRTTVSSVKPGLRSSTRLISMALLSSTFEIFAEDFYGQRAFQSGERFVHGVFGGLREVENDAGEGVELLLRHPRSVRLWCG